MARLPGLTMSRSASAVTWIHPAGWYVDMVGKYTQLSDDFHTPTLNGTVATADYSVPVFGAPLSLGGGLTSASSDKVRQP
jgi:outer membrane autotransporter protein